MLSHGDLREELDIPVEEWSQADQDRATRILARSRVVVVGWAGRSRVVRAEVDRHSEVPEVRERAEAQLAAVDEAVLEYARRRFVNPERLMQAREGSDQSSSYADSSDAATGRKEVQEILRGAFGNRAVSVRT
jgi:hypothetical protein